MGVIKEHTTAIKVGAILFLFALLFILSIPLIVHSADYALKNKVCYEPPPRPGGIEGEPDCLIVVTFDMTPIELRREHMKCYYQIGDKKPVEVSCPW